VGLDEPPAAAAPAAVAPAAASARPTAPARREGSSCRAAGRPRARGASPVAGRPEERHGCLEERRRRRRRLPRNVRPRPRYAVRSCRRTAGPCRRSWRSCAPPGTRFATP
jgi:hypothetical protein